jgi:hypothetical protein
LQNLLDSGTVFDYFWGETKNEYDERTNEAKPIRTLGARKKNNRMDQSAP